LLRKQKIKAKKFLTKFNYKQVVGKKCHIFGQKYNIFGQKYHIFGQKYYIFGQKCYIFGQKVIFSDKNITFSDQLLFDSLIELYSGRIVAVVEEAVVVAAQVADHVQLLEQDQLVFDRLTFCLLGDCEHFFGKLQK
jgi:hypothetical protein